MISIIIPANNEANYIANCLEHLLCQQDTSLKLVQIVVVANGCSDNTVEIVNGFSARFERKSWVLKTLQIEERGKTLALNAGDAAATHLKRLYIDADVLCGPRLVSEVFDALDRDDAVYVGATIRVAEPWSFITRKYSKIWLRLPFTNGSGPTGAGLYAVNEAGRLRWTKFPDIVSDDAFIRLLFAPTERLCVVSPYYWYLAEGAFPLAKTRRRQDNGIRELKRLKPEIFVNYDTPRLSLTSHLKLISELPLSYVVYVGIYLLARLHFFHSEERWYRGRR